jgi:hypothetical protein
VVGLAITAAVVAICLILLGVTGDFLVDWLWFSAISYLGVFWTTIVAKAEVFFAIFLVTAIVLWVNGWLASRFARSPWMQHTDDFEWKRTCRCTFFARNRRGVARLYFQHQSSTEWEQVMAKCETCGNDYDKAFQVSMNGTTHTFDSFECAIHALAPTCDNCGIHILGHGLEKEGTFFCCDHCAEAKGVTGLRDRIGAGGVIEMGSPMA